MVIVMAMTKKKSKLLKETVQLFVTWDAIVRIVHNIYIYIFLMVIHPVLHS